MFFVVRMAVISARHGCLLAAYCSAYSSFLPSTRSCSCSMVYRFVGCLSWLWNCYMFRLSTCHHAWLHVCKLSFLSVSLQRGLQLYIYFAVFMAGISFPLWLSAGWPTSHLRADISVSCLSRAVHRLSRFLSASQSRPECATLSLDYCT
jgi:hypothetical protein